VGRTVRRFIRCFRARLELKPHCAATRGRTLSVNYLPQHANRIATGDLRQIRF